MNTIRVLFTLCLFAAAIVSARADAAGPQLVVTPSGEGRFIIDFANDGGDQDITALMFSIDIGDAPKQSVDLSECVSGLPQTHVGFCRYNPGVVKVVIYSNSNALLETSHIGVVSVSSHSAVGNNGFQRRRELMAGRGAGAASAVVRIEDAIFTRPDGTDISGEVLQ